MVGQTISHYRILDKLGEGGMGVVYRAVDLRLDRVVALKLLPPDEVADPELNRRFIREAKAASALSHPNIVTIYDIDTASDNGASFLFIAMEYVDGKTLADVLTAGPLPITRALSYGLQIADGLAAAHVAGIVHRDIKPANLLIDRRGSVRILDFGLAKVTPAPAGNATATFESATKPGIVLGTAPYMSPEQAMGQPVDARSDVFSLGAVFYEMLAGRRAFRGDSFAGIVGAVVHHTPASLHTVRRGLPPALVKIVERCLAKDSDARYSSAVELRRDLSCVQEEIASRTVAFQRSTRRREFAMATIAIVAVAGLAAVWLSWRASRARWARTIAVSEIERLIGNQRKVAALSLLDKAQRFAPNDPELARIRHNIVRPVSVLTQPSDADVYIRDYIDATADTPWQSLGRTPLNNVITPGGHLRYRITKKGFHAAEGDIVAEFMGASVTVRRTLDSELDGPADMVRVPAAPGRNIDEFWIDRFEVRNRQFRDFVARRPYERREYWRHPFHDSGRVVSWDTAIANFKDTTGRFGPATWEFGSFPEGRDNYPVAGVSWYEAAAYCESMGKTLPSALHWRTAAGTAAYIVTIFQVSNFGGRGPAPVGAHAGVGQYGTYDSAGNVREWCWNSSGEKRIMLGGAWNEPSYMFNLPDERFPLDRSPTNGFRCAKYMEPPSEQLTAPVNLLQFARAQHILFYNRDRRSDKPVDVETFQIYRALHSYDRSEIRGRVEAVDDSSPHWRREKVQFPAAYGTESVTAHLFVPKNTNPPFQAVVHFPNLLALDFRDSTKLETQFFDFFIRSGRAVLHPIYKGTYERSGGGSSRDFMIRPNVGRELRIQWARDLGRSIDYLETRPDIAVSKLAYHGVSLGASEGPRLLALEPRLKAAVLFWAGAYAREEISPEVDPLNFAPHSRIPTLLVNGRDDFMFQVEKSQRPLFHSLGTPDADKRHLIIEGGHAPLTQEVVRQTLAWLDRYLGNVNTR